MSDLDGLSAFMNPSQSPSHSEASDESTRISPSNGTTFRFEYYGSDMKNVSNCMWSAGRIGDIARHITETVKLEDETFNVVLTLLPETRHIQNPTNPDQHCLWPVFFRGKLARQEPTLVSLEEHMKWSPMGNVERNDNVSWFATDPGTALKYGYPDVYGVPAGRTLRLLNVADPGTVQFIHTWYRKHYERYRTDAMRLSMSAATTAFVLNKQRDRVERNTEWTADTHVSNLLAQSQDLLANLRVDGWALDWTSLMHTEVMLLNAFPKLQFMGSMLGPWEPRDVALIGQKYTDFEQLSAHRRRKVEAVERHKKRRWSKDLKDASDSDDPPKTNRLKKLDFDF